MELPLDLQLRGLLLGLAMGLGLGLIYLLICPIRRRSGSLGWLFDAVFALAAGFGLFVLSMCMPLGRPVLWEIAAAILGFWAFMSLVSPLLSPILDGLFALLLLPFKKMYPKIRKFLNFFFQKVK